MVRPVGGGPSPEVPKTNNVTVPPQLSQWKEEIEQAISRVKQGQDVPLGMASYLIGHIEGQLLAYGYNPNRDPLGSLVQACDFLNSSYEGSAPDIKKVCDFLVDASNKLNQLQPIDKKTNNPLWMQALQDALTTFEQSHENNADARRLLNIIGIVQDQIDLYPNDTQLQLVSAKLSAAVYAYEIAGPDFTTVCQRVTDAINLL